MRRLMMARRRLSQSVADLKTDWKTDWLQVNCSVFAQGADGSTYTPWAALEAAVKDWQAEGRFDQFFFMRKPPGLRLRFRGSELVKRLEPVLVAWLEDAERRNLIRSFRFAIYEPETYLFGGPVGMDVAHDQFNRDSRLVLHYETLADSNSVELARDELTLQLMNDLFRHFADDQSELWDIWQRIWHGHGCPPLAPSASDRLERDRALLAGHLSSGSQLLEWGRADNKQIARRLHAAEVAGRLRCGPRAWLSLACTFHWNRLGLSFEARLPLLASMLQLLDPHGV
jgi:thiopeptide-type bacteriocin biosynthesis protein